MSEKSSVFLAHVRPDSNGQWLPHHLEDHLRGVADLAESFAAAFGAGDWAKLAGLWHDLGKYREAFQRYIRSASGYEAHIETSLGKVDHSTAGALYAMERMKGLGRILAYLIAGHHAGLPDWQSAEAPVSSLDSRLRQAKLLTDTLVAAPPADILNASLPTSNPGGERDHALWIRLLFSCLVDADFLDTEHFMAPDKTAQRGRYPTLAELGPRFEAHMARLAGQVEDTPVNRIRARVLERWVLHMLGVQVQIEPVHQINDSAWRWHVGLDVESTAILNDLYQDRPVEAERMARLVSLFTLTFANPAEMRADVAGKPVYLGLATNAEGLVRIKPQNLLLNLPLATVS